MESVVVDNAGPFLAEAVVALLIAKTCNGNGKTKFLGLLSKVVNQLEKLKGAGHAA
jgi:hypothetical protein